MNQGFLKDNNGNYSSTRIFEAFMIITVIIIAFVSVFTGKDLGSNVASMLQFIVSFALLGFEGKKGMEFLSKKKK